MALFLAVYLNMPNSTAARPLSVISDVINDSNKLIECSALFAAENEKALSLAAFGTWRDLGVL